MFHSDNSDNPLESLFKRPSFQLSDQNPISKQDDPLFFSNFPSPFFDEHEYLPLNQMLLSDNMLQPENHQEFVADQNENKPDSTKKETAKSGKSKEKGRNLGVVPRRRTGKKDRHSKICTAQGIRDRRMRLSLQVARKFFDLQDMLGYDKASKTIEWLFCKSKKAIKELTKDNPQRNNSNSVSTDAKSESFISECEVVSGIEEINSNNKIKSTKKCKTINMRESREKARARARSRTREKLMIKNLCKSSPNNQNDISKLGSSSSPFEGVDEERVSTHATDFPHQLGDVGTIEKLLGSSCPNISDYNYNYNCSDPNSNFMGFLGNWDLFNNDSRLNSSHFAVTNQVSFTGNYPNSVYSVTTPNFQLFHQ
ncbi:hypothetical protein CDL12_03597 [Handroanthus impetiginosus]|uniref:TCP domain-containing protein n=1 Tax=Handroanthus impetiginosus TaxID=429701 RepID=A0A2G9I1P2_9LAMI|nr:hypothetical protein CDL12_03597 [Handroanthus impetiginosus]